MKLLACILLLLAFVTKGDSQRSCATDAGFTSRMANDPAYIQFYNDVVVPSELDFANANRIPCDGTNAITVPVAFHFDESFACTDIACILTETQDQLDQLNLAFGSNTGTAAEAACPQAYQDALGNSVASTGTCITFCYAEAPACSNLQACDLPITIDVFNGGINGGGSGAGACWSGVMNIFITNNQCLGVADGIPGAANGDGVTVCSPAFGGAGGPSGCGLDTDGTFNLGYTLVHEVGHYLGLYHTFQGGCGTQEENPPGPIQVLDTPAHTTPTGGCPGGCLASGCGGGVTPTANFMDYTDDACMSMFTEDQAAVMNYWANQLFGSGAVACSDATTLESCDATVAVCVCPMEVTVPYAGSDVACVVAGAVTLPTDFSSVVSDAPGTFVWSTGGYLSAGGTATASPYTPTVPTTCAPVEEILYLNLTCSEDATILLDAGTYTLTVYPDPTTFTIDDLVTFSDGGCNGPTFVIDPDCVDYVTVTQTSGPTFPVTTGVGTVTYDVSLNYPTECCCTPTFCTVTVPNTTPTAIPDSGGPANPGCMDVIITCDGPVTNVDVTVDITHSWVGDLIVTITSPAGTSIILGDRPGEPASGFGCAGDDMVVTWDDGATLTNADFENTCANAPAIAGTFQPAAPLGTFNGEPAAGTWTVCVSDNAGGDTGTINSIEVTVDSEEPCTDPVLCTFVGMADYNCAEACTDCADTACTTVQACDDGDPCTGNDMETVLLSDGTVCVECAGTAVAACTAPPVVQACDDGDPCTENDMESIDACDGTTVCVPCAGTAVAPCTLTPVVQACDDGNDCTENDMESIDACDGSICVPCAGTATVAPCTLTPIVQACDDGDPCTANDMESVDACDLVTVCVPCMGTAVAACTAPPVVQACDDGDPCTENDMESIDACDGTTVCVPCAGTAIATCSAPPVVQACDDGDPCTENDMESIDACDGTTVCVPCAGTALASGCTDPTACNYDPAAICDDGTCDFGTCVDCAYVIANNIDICDYIAANPGSILETLDCDGGGIANGLECSASPATDPLNAEDDCDADNGTLDIKRVPGNGNRN